VLNINYASVIDPVLHHTRTRLPGFAGMKAGDRVLDVCCGSGAQVYEYLRKGIAAQGLDIDPHMLALAKRYYSTPGAAPDTFIEGDAAHMPFPDGSFDFTSISLALHDKDTTLAYAIVAEMKRVTRQGGMIVFLDYSMPLPRSLKGFLIRATERLAGGEHFRNFNGYLENGGLDRITENNGLAAVKTERLLGGNITLVLAKNG